MNVKQFCAAVLVLGVISLSILQISIAESASKTELALTNLLQLIFSFGFAWIVASYFSEKDFLKDQKKFAIGAYRRIKDIELNITRAQRLISDAQDLADFRNSSSHQTVMINLLCIQESVSSSVADWRDIVGDDTGLTKEISRLTDVMSRTDHLESGYFGGLGEKNSGVNDLNKELSRLGADIPDKVKYHFKKKEKSYRFGNYFFLEAINNNYNIKLRGVWDPNDSLTDDTSVFKLKETLFISRGVTELRGEVLLAYDNSNNEIGVIENKFFEYNKKLVTEYQEFLDIFEDILGYKFLPVIDGGVPLPIILTSIDGASVGGHIRFTANLNFLDMKNDRLIGSRANI